MSALPRMTESLRWILLKLDRAQEHLDILEERMRPLHQRTCKLLRQHDAKTGMDEWRIILPRPEETIPLIIGDCLHNLRSSLDHLVYQLVRSAGHEPTRSHQFPIVASEYGWHRQVTKGRLQGVPLDAQALIKSLQPFMPRRLQINQAVTDRHLDERHR